MAARSLGRLAAASAALLGLGCWATPLWAQGASNAPPAERMLVSPGGVDMRSGRYAYEQTDLAVGSESGGLTLARTLAQQVPGHANPFGNFSHNWEILLNEKRIDVFHNLYTNEPGRPDYQIEIAYDGVSQTFRARGQNEGFEQTSRAGFGALSAAGDRNGPDAVYTFLTGDGTQAVFRPIGGADCSTLLRCAAVAQITQPDGTRLDFGYDDQGGPDTTRLRSVTSSRGYALLLEYEGAVVSKACLLNLTVTPKPANNLCPEAAQAVATYTYTSVAGQPRLASATDAAGAVWGFTNPAIGAAGFIRPGETTPWLVNHGGNVANGEGVTSDVVASQSFADGSTYVYDYDYTPQVTGQEQTLAGGAYTDNLGNRTTLRYDFPVLPNPGAGGGNVPGNDEDPQPVTYQVTPGPVEITDPLGRVTRVDYCDANAMANLPGLNRCIVMPMPVSVTDAEGIKTRFVTDMFSRNLLERRQVAKAGSGLPDIVARATYYCVPATARYCNKPLTRTDARGSVTDYTYDPAHGGLLTETGPAPSAGAPRPQARHIYAQRYAWISNGAGGWAQAASPIWVRTATSACRTSAATGNPAAPCAVAGDEVLTAYDYGPDSGPNTLLLRGQTVSADGVTLRSCYGYDALGRRIAETQPNANLASCPAALPGPAPYTSGTRYDAAGRVTGTISADPDGAGALPFLAVRNSYDAAGRLTKVETGSLAAWQLETVAPASWANFTIFRTLETSYDVMGRKTRDSLRDGAAGTVRTMTQHSYDAVGRLECTAVRMSPAVFASLPASACTPGAAASDGPDRIARNVYNAAGERIQLREGVGTSDEGTEATWAYNLSGQITTVIDGNGNRADLHYDGHGRQDRWTFPSTTRAAAYNDATQASALASASSINTNDYEAYSYDANGNRTNLRKRDTRNIAFAYDALNRVTSKTYPNGGATPVFYSYDLRNLQLSARFDSQAGQGITSTYDGFGRLASSSTDLTGPSPRTLSYGYDANGNRTRLVHPDGAQFNFWYNGLNRPYYLFNNSSGGMAYVSYHPIGAPMAMGHAGTTSYGYDGVQRPASLAHSFSGGAGSVVWAFGRNPAGQLGSVARDNDAFAWTGAYSVNRPYTANGLNQYSAAGSASFTYDANGNLISDGTRTYSYDIENRLVGASGPGGSQVQLGYDPLGRLSWTTGSPNFTRFLYDGDALVAEYDYAGTTMTRRYAHWVGADVPLVSYEGDSLANASGRWLFVDHQGSIVAAAYPSESTAWVNTYDEYGIPGAGNQGRFQYTGQIWLAELGMYYYKARVYSPTLGRFLQTDPLGYEDQFNLYTYVGNDPINLVDSSGARIACGAETCRITADTYRADRSTHQTTNATPEMRSAMEAQASALSVHSGSNESLGYGTRVDGQIVVRSVNSQTENGTWAAVTNGTIPVNSLFAAHGHIDSGENRNDGMVDDPESNGGYGDTISLSWGNPMPMATVSTGKVGWHEIEDGRLVFTAPAAALSREQRRAIQRNLNVSQRRFQRRKPTRRGSDVNADD